jgi:hypothetical protein
MCGCKPCARAAAHLLLELKGWPQVGVRINQLVARLPSRQRNGLPRLDVLCNSRQLRPQPRICQQPGADDCKVKEALVAGRRTDADL